MGFQDAAFQPSQGSVYTTFLVNGGRGESLGTTTYTKTVAAGKKGHAPVKHLRSNKASVSCQSNVMEIIDC